MRSVSRSVNSKSPIPKSCSSRSEHHDNENKNNGRAGEADHRVEQAKES